VTIYLNIVICATVIFAVDFYLICRFYVVVINFDLIHI